MTSPTPRQDCIRCGHAYRQEGVIAAEFWTTKHPQPMRAGFSEPVRPCPSCITTDLQLARDLLKPLLPALARFGWEFLHLRWSDGRTSDRITRADVERPA